MEIFVVATKDFLFGFVLAMPFMWINRYVLRTSLSMLVPLAIYWWFLWQLSAPVDVLFNRHAFVLFLGGLCAAQMKLIWTLVRNT
jgi:hypothetical protein